MLIAITFVLIAPTFTQAQVIFEVKSGDSLDKISKQHHLNRGEIAKLNGLAFIHTHNCKLLHKLDEITNEPIGP